MANANTITPPENASALSHFRPTFANDHYDWLLPCAFQVFRTCLRIFLRKITPLLFPTTCPESVSYRDYDVFLNHRGPDVKTIFATDLHECLGAFGFQVFLDEPEMQVGLAVPGQIEHAIETATIHIAVFSPTYAKSHWCLNELGHMSKKCKSRQAIIIPVFYGVEPSVVRGTRKGQTGEYAKALSEHEKKQHANFQTIQRWRDALSHVASITGFELKKCDGNDELLGKIVRHVLDVREKRRLKYVVREEIGKTVRTLLQPKAQLQIPKLTSRRNLPKFMGIVGPAGMGKTMLVKEFWGKDKSKYSGSCFLSDVKERSRVSLLRKFMKDLTQSNVQIDNVEQGIHKLKTHILSSKALKYLIVLDDVDDATQMKYLTEVWNVLTSKSFILVTSRSKDVLISAGIKESSIYNLTSSSKTNLILAGDWLEKLPDCLDRFKNLKELWLRDSPNLMYVSRRSFHQPNPFSSYQLLKQLTELTITDCGIISLIQELEKMNNLKILRVCNCPLDNLSFRKTVVKSTSQRDVALLSPACKSEEPCLQGVCPNLQHLWIYSCRDLVKVGSLPKSLKTVDLSNCNRLKKIEGLPYLESLQQLDISGCEVVEELPSLQTLKSLESFKASKCYKLKSIKGLVDLRNLQTLYVRDCHEIRELPGLPDLERLKQLNISGCEEIEELPGVEHCKSLRELDARDCSKLQWADGVLDQLRRSLEVCLVGDSGDGHGRSSDLGNNLFRSGSENV